MNVYDILLGALLILIIALAVRKIYRDKKSGKTCSCGCGSSAGCSGNCSICASGCSMARKKDK